MFEWIRMYGWQICDIFYIWCVWECKLCLYKEILSYWLHHLLIFGVWTCSIYGAAMKI